MIGEERCPTCGQERKRSLAMNNRYWKLVREMSRVSGEFDPESFHEYFKMKFLPIKEIDMPDWSTRLVPVSTSNLPMHRDPKDPDKPNWDDYCMEVEKWCAERGVYLENV